MTKAKKALVAHIKKQIRLMNSRQTHIGPDIAKQNLYEKTQQNGKFKPQKSKFKKNNV